MSSGKRLEQSPRLQQPVGEVRQDWNQGWNHQNRTKGTGKHLGVDEADDLVTLRGLGQGLRQPRLRAGSPKSVRGSKLGHENWSLWSGRPKSIKELLEKPRDVVRGGKPGGLGWIYREERQFVSWKDLQSMGEGEPNSKFAGRVRMLDHPCDLPIG